MIFDDVQVNLQEFLARIGISQLRRVGDELMGECPWSEHRKGGRNKFYINENTGAWICHACANRKGSNLARLVSEIKGIGYKESVLYIKEFGQDIDFETFGNYIIDTMYEDHVPTKLRKEKALIRQTRSVMRSSKMKLHSGYWHERGLSPETIKEWGLMINPNPRYPNIIPVSVWGKDLYFIRRAQDNYTNPKYLDQRGFPRRRILFGLDRARSSTLVLCEGPLDAIFLWQHLHEKFLLHKYSPVAVFGKSLNEEQIALVESNADQAILFFDNDGDGILAAVKASRQIVNIPLRVVDYGKLKVKDPGDLTADESVRMLKKSKSISELLVEERLRNAIED